MPRGDAIRLFIQLLVFLLGAGAPVELYAQEVWPTKPIKVIVPLAPGGAADLVMRAIGEEMTASVKQQFILENRPGGGGTLAAEMVVRAAPDGYTLLMGNSAIFGIAPYLVKKLSYDPLKDFTPLTTVVELPIVLAVNSAVPANNVAEFINYAKKNSGKLSFGSSGYGTTMHLAGELLNHQAGIEMVHIPYKGGAPALVDVMSGQIPVVMAALSTVAPHIGGGKIKVLATVEAKRSASHPDIPTVGETLPGYWVPSSWLGILAPAGLPEPIADRMHAEFVRATNTPHVRALLEKNGFELNTRRRAEFAAELRDSLIRFGKIAEAAKISAQ
jgi:tripartite-type tricarboxylate transporter receptor subunit TctC